MENSARTGRRIGIALFVALLWHGAASARDDLRLIGFACNKVENTVEVSYFTDYNRPSRPMELWDTFDLKRNVSSDSYVASVRKVVRTCKLGRDRFVVTLFGIPGNWNMNGECGGETYGGATIARNGVRVFHDALDGCLATEVTARVRFNAGSKVPEISKLSQDEFVFGKSPTESK